MKTAKGQITLVTIPEQITYELQPSVTQIMINTDGTISTPIITCTAYKIEGNVRTILSAQEGTIKYNTSNNQTYQNYDTANGVTVNAQWSFITFFLFLTEGNNPIVRFDVPITRNGQIDTNFRVWVGTVADPNTLLQYPWVGEQNEPQETYMHVQDYYISPDMTYYCFVNSGTELNPVYKWEEVTDATLKRWLERANNSTTGFIVTYHEGTAVNTDVQNFFQNRNYIIGDLWSNAKYTITQNNETVYLYNDEPLICKQSKTNGFNINDWQPISAIKTKLKDTGIDIDEYKVTITADETWAVNNAGERVAIINNVDGHPKITASLLQINGDVQIDGSAIIESIGNSNEAQENLVGLLSDNDIIPTTVTHNNDGTVTVQSGNDQYITYTKNAIDNSDFVKFNVQNGSGNSSFTLNKNGLLTADNAVIYGELHATNGEFFEELQSAGGAFKVDSQGNVVATSFNGQGVIFSGITYITEQNFYDYFVQSSLDISNGNDVPAQGATSTTICPYNKRWIPNLRKLQQRIIFRSIPQSILYHEPNMGKDIATIVLPHCEVYNGTTPSSYSIRRGGLMQTELYHLCGKTYSFEITDEFIGAAIFIYPTLDQNPAIVGPTGAMNGNEKQHCVYQYKISDSYSTMGVWAYDYTDQMVDDWIDKEPSISGTNSNSSSSEPDKDNNGGSIYFIEITCISREQNKFNFRYTCSCPINITQLTGRFAFLGSYIQNNQIKRCIFSGPFVYGTLGNNNSVVQATSGEYASGYFYVTTQDTVPNDFKFDNMQSGIQIGNDSYKIHVFASPNDETLE